MITFDNAYIEFESIPRRIDFSDMGFPTITSAWSNTIAQDLVPVQPMSEPTGDWARLRDFQVRTHGRDMSPTYPEEWTITNTLAENLAYPLQVSDWSHSTDGARRIFNIPVGQADAEPIGEYIQRIRDKFNETSEEDIISRWNDSGILDGLHASSDDAVTAMMAANLPQTVPNNLGEAVAYKGVGAENKLTEMLMNDMNRRRND